MKTSNVLVILLLICSNSFGQVIDDKELIIKMSNKILEEATYDFIDTSNGRIVHEENFMHSEKIIINSPYNTWHYWNGVLNIAIKDLGEFLRDDRLIQYPKKNYEFAFKYGPIFKEHYKNEYNKWVYPFGQYIVMDELDDCGAMGAGLIEVLEGSKNKQYEEYVQRAAHHIMYEQDRLEDGTLVRGGPQKYTLWGDDLYMGLVFLARMGAYTGEQKYFDEAAKQVIQFTHYLYNPTSQLYYHCYYSDNKENGVAHWGRCNGWVLMAQTELLDHLPQNHPQRDTLVSIFHQQVLGLSRYQSPTGLWHQLLDKNDSYLETSCTAMFTYSIAKAINKGWLDKRYQSIAERGWEGLKSSIDDDGNVQGICVGTGISDDIIYYYSRPTLENDIHGLGAVLLSGIEMLKIVD